jgi:exopolysaccharide biosynthesis protein
MVAFALSGLPHMVQAKALSRHSAIVVKKKPVLTVTKKSVVKTHKESVLASDARFLFEKKKDGYAVTLNLTKGIQMRVTTGHDSIRATEECRYPKYCKAEAQAEAFSSFTKRLSDAKLVMNGGYFDAYSQKLDEKNYHTVSSDLVINGEMKSMYGWDKAWGDGGMIAQKKDGSFAFYYPIRNWVAEADTIQTAVSNYPLVLLNGVVKTKSDMVVSDPNDRKFWISGRRGGLGLSADGSKLVYVSIVGTVEDLGAALLKAGAANGFALDAGGSNGLAYEGKTLFTPGRKLASVISFR